MQTQPPWVTSFVSEVCECLRALDDMPPIGCHCVDEEETWEISIFVSPTEIVGGPHDGERLVSIYAVDLLGLLHLFDVVESAGWQSHPADSEDELGNHIAVEGYYGGHHIWLRILSDTPERFTPGRFLNVIEKRYLDTWEL